MTIISGPTMDFTGQIGFYPRVGKMVTTANFATVTAPGYLSQSSVNGGFFNTDIINTVYNYTPGSDTGIYDIMEVTVADGIVTLSPVQDTGSTLLPTVPHQIIVANNAEGTLQNFVGTIFQKGTIWAGNNGIAGILSSWPSAADTGSLSLVAFANSGNFGNAITNAPTGQTCLWQLPDPLTSSTVNINVSPAALVNGNLVKASGTTGLTADSGLPANQVMTSSFASPDVSANLVYFNVTVTEAALASGGSVTLYTSSGSKQYVPLMLFMNAAGVNFSGGSGNRLLSITDGTTVYSLVPATNLQTLVNAGYGISTPMPFPASAPINTKTVAGASLVAKYSGGSADYTAGSVTITGLLIRVA